MKIEGGILQTLISGKKSRRMKVACHLPGAPNLKRKMKERNVVMVGQE
jgi:hypothetical protein